MDDYEYRCVGEIVITRRRLLECTEAIAGDLFDSIVECVSGGCVSSDLEVVERWKLYLFTEYRISEANTST